MFIQFNFFIDILSILLIILTTWIIFLCIINTNQIFINPLYFITLFSLNFSIIIVFMISNILWLYVFFEASLIPMYILINVWGSRERKIRAGFYFFLYTVFGSSFMLTGLLIIYDQTETLLLNQIICFDFTFEQQVILWFCFFMGFAVKIPIMPSHLWLPEAHVEAPTIGSVILASLPSKLGGYGFIRILLPLFPLATNFFLPIVYMLALISILYASVISLRQIDMKRIIAYSSIAHMNVVVLGIFSNTLHGIIGAIFLMIAHGLVSGALFLLVGVLYERYHSRLLNYYTGLLQVMPLFSVIFCFFSLANLSLPGTCNFIGEFLNLIGILQANTAVLVLSGMTTIGSAVYSLWLFNRICFGQLKISSIAQYKDLTQKEFFIFLPIIFLTIILGFFPNYILIIF